MSERPQASKNGVPNTWQKHEGSIHVRFIKDSEMKQYYYHLNPSQDNSTDECSVVFFRYVI